jgi:hypothetical protein
MKRYRWDASGMVEDEQGDFVKHDEADVAANLVRTWFRLSESKLDAAGNHANMVRCEMDMRAFARGEA